MAFQWTITSIAVGKISPQEQLFPTTNTDGQRVDPANPIIWQPGVNYQNGTDGSTNPVTFQLPTATDQTWMLPMTLSGSITFPAAWYGTRFKLVGSLNGTAIVENDPMVATVAPVWSFSQLRLLSALPFVNPRDPSYAFLIPFRISGDWTWAIQPVSLPIPVGSAVLPTRLELSFALCSAFPNNTSNTPLWPPISSIDSQPDLGGSYPVAVQRYAFPNLSELGPTMLTTQAQAYQWYVARMVSNVWANGVGNPCQTYDSKIGKSGFNMAGLGGVFDLKRWISIIDTCNCFDLAAVMQLGCAIALSATGSEYLRSNWVFQGPYGYVPEGELFGQPTIPNCNNPFYQNSKYNPNPDCPENDLKRSPFGSHAWVEVQLDRGVGLQRYAVDVTHALLDTPTNTNVPESGTKLRSDYLLSNRDDQGYDVAARTGNQIVWTASQTNGNCYQNPDTRLPRIGVFGTNMDPPAGALPTTTYVNAITVKLSEGSLEFLLEAPSDGPSFIGRDCIEVLRRGKNSPIRAPRFNNASLRQQTVRELTSTALNKGATTIYSQLFPERDCTTSSQVFIFPTTEGATSESPQLQISLDIKVHNSQEAAIKALGDYLSSFTVTPLESHIYPTPSPLGEVSLYAHGVLFWVHGNVFVQIRTNRPQMTRGGPQEILPTTRAIDEDLTSIASRLEEHLTSGDTDPTNVRRGSISFTASPPTQIRKSTSYTLQVEPAGAEIPEIEQGEKIVAFVSDPRLMSSCGPADAEGRLTFAAFSPGQVKIEIVRPQIETLMPGVKSFVIEILDAEE